MITVKVEYSRAKRIGDTPTLTSGMVGVPIRFEFSAEWEGLEKTAVFSNGEEDIAVWLTGDETVIPWEVLANAGDNVLVGIYGADASHAIVIPTVTALLGVVHQGTTGEGAEGMDPTLPVWAQLQQNKQDKLTEADKQAIADMAKLEVYVAEYGVTTLLQIRIAAAQGRVIVCKMNDRIFMPLMTLSPMLARFGYSIGGVIGTAECMSNGWHFGSMVAQRALTAGENIMLDSEGNISAQVTAPVDSVNGKVGAVNLAPSDIGAQAAIDDLAAIRSGAAAGATALQSETDPTVPNWAKQAQKPTYTAEEVGALAVGYHDDTKQNAISDLEIIRAGAAAGATALQAVPNTYRTAEEQDEIHDSTKQDTLTAGDNITISDNGTISATGGGSPTYIGDTEPVEAEAGSLWVDTDDNSGSQENRPKYRLYKTVTIEQDVLEYSEEFEGDVTGFYAVIKSPGTVATQLLLRAYYTKNGEQNEGIYLNNVFVTSGVRYGDVEADIKDGMLTIEGHMYSTALGGMYGTFTRNAKVDLIDKIDRFYAKANTSGTTIPTGTEFTIYVRR